MEWTEAKEELRKCLPQLCNDLQITELLTILEADGFFSKTDGETIMVRQKNATIDCQR